MSCSFKKRLPYLFFLLSIFVFFLFFFVKLHPIVISDTDDWWYTYYHREAIPIWNDWNPSRVFPEVFMPLVSMIGAYFIYPLSGNYFSSLSFCYALSVSLAITFLCFALLYYLRNFKFSGWKSAFLLCIYFLISHFWIFRIHQTGNDYMFRAVNACTYFYYVIPNLLNSTFILLFASYIENRTKASNLQLALLVILSYFCIFSNIWASCITASYIGATLLIDLVAKLKAKQFSIHIFIMEHKLRFILVFVWIIAQFFELSGGRSDSLDKIDFISGIKESIQVLYFELTQMNRPFLISAFIVLTFGTFFDLKHQHFNILMKKLLFILSAFFSTAYLVLSCAKTAPGYLYRTDVFYSVFFFGMIVLILSLYSIFIVRPEVKIFVPLLLFIALINCNTEIKTYSESNICQFAPSLWNKVNDDLMRQFVTADSAGKTELTLYIPCFQGEDNWPLALYASHRYSEHFYKMGITKTKVTVTDIIPSTAKNSELLIPEASAS